MESIILAGGFGSRLNRDVGSKIPKPLVEVAGKPLLGYSIDLSETISVERIVISVSYLSTLIMDRYGHSTEAGTPIAYEIDDPPMGDAGSLRDAYRKSSGRIVMLNGDEIRIGLDLEKMLDFHLQNDSVATVAVTEVADPQNHGIFVCGPGGIAQSFSMNPKDLSRGLANAGCYIFEEDVLGLIPGGYQMFKDVLPGMVGSGRMFCFPFSGQYFNVGTREVLRKARGSLSH